MRRLSAEIAEAMVPDAAPKASGPGRGHPARSGRWPVEALAWCDGGRPKLLGPGAPAARHQRWVGSPARAKGSLKGLPTGGRAEQASNTARGTPAGTADLRLYFSGSLPECLDAVRCRGPWV